MTSQSQNKDALPRDVRPFTVDAEQTVVEGIGDEESGLLSWRTLISGDRTPSAEMTVGVADFPPHGRLNPHRHAPAEFYFGIAGDGIVTIDGSPFPIAKGIAVFIPGSCEHGVVAGASGLSIVYGFAQESYDRIVYRFSPP